MTALFRVRTSLTGFPGAPGVSTMYVLNTNTIVPSVQAFWGALSGNMPVNMTAQVENVGDVIESTTGELTGAWSVNPVAPVVGAAAGTYAGPAGAVVSWLTTTVSDGKRLQGRTYIVPLASVMFDTDGTLTAGKLAIVKAAADALLFEQSLSLVVWRRPRAARPADGSRPAVTFRAGSHGLVTATRVPDKAAVLRSRRD